MSDDLTRIVRYLADTSKAVAEINKLTDATKKAGDQMEGVGAKLSNFASFLKKAGAFLLIEESIKKVIGGIHGLIEEFDELGKTAQGIGLTTEQLSALQYAADLAGVGAEQLTKALVSLDDKIAHVGTGTDTASKALRSFGVTGADDAASALDKIADGFAKMADGPEKSAIALALFGKAAAKMIPLLNGGAASLKELTDEAARFGQVITDKVKNQAEAFNDNLARMQRTSKSVGIQLTAGMLPALAALSESFVDSATTGDGFISTGKDIGEMLLNLYGFALKASATIQGFGKVLGAVAAAVVNPTKAGTIFGEMLDDVNALEAAANKKLGKLSADFEKFNKTTTPKKPKRDKPTDIFDDKPVKESKDAFTEWEASVTSAMAAVDMAAPKIAYLEQLIVALGEAGPEGAKKLEVVTKLLEQIKPPDALTKYVRTLEEAARAQIPVADQMNGIVLRMIALQGQGEEAERVIEALRKEYEKLKATTSTSEGVAFAVKQLKEATAASDAWNAELANLVFTGQISGEVFRKLLKDVPEAFNKTNDSAEDLNKTITGSLQQSTAGWIDGLIDGFGKADQSFQDFIANALKAIAKLIAQRQVMQAFNTWFPAAGAAKGAAFDGAGVEFMARGGILTSPTFFTTARGPAVAGEAGPEAVVPLRRTSGGDLGVAASPVTINVQNYTEASVSQRTTDNADGSRVVDMLIERKVRSMVADGTLDRPMRASYGVTRQPG